MKTKLLALLVLLVLVIASFQSFAGFVPNKRTVYQQCYIGPGIPGYELVCVSDPDQGCFTTSYRPEP